MPSLEEQLLRLAVNDEALVTTVLGNDPAGCPSVLKPRTAALVRLAALIALDAETPSYQSVVDEALACGTDLDEVVAVLITVAPAIGQARLVSAAPKLALGMGIDVHAGLEDIDPPSSSQSSRTPDRSSGGADREVCRR